MRENSSKRNAMPFTRHQHFNTSALYLSLSLFLISTLHYQETVNDLYSYSLIIQIITAAASNI